jgi:hypothetical protein
MQRMKGELKMISLPIELEDRLTRTEALLAAVRQTPTVIFAASEPTPARDDPQPDWSLLLRVAVGYLDVTDEELLEMLEHRLHRFLEARDCANCSDSRCAGQRGDRPPRGWL